MGKCYVEIVIGKKVIINKMKPEQKILKDIKEYGWHVIHVLENEEGQKYSYTIGLAETFGHSEIAISGLPPDTCKMIFSEIVESIKSKTTFTEDIEYDNILDGYNCIFKIIDTKKFSELFGKAEWYYKTSKYSVLQLFYPDKQNNFPWNENYAMSVQEVL